MAPGSAHPADRLQCSGRAGAAQPTPDLEQTFSSCARHTAEQAHPEYGAARILAETTSRDAAAAEVTHTTALRVHDQRLADHRSLGLLREPAGRLTAAEQSIDRLTAQLQQVRARIHALELEPAIRGLPAGRLETEHDTWQDNPSLQHVPGERTKGAGHANRPQPKPGPGIGVEYQRRQPPSLDRERPGGGFSR
jgi:exodeoxyribonuclease V alpha subunit